MDQRMFSQFGKPKAIFGGSLLKSHPKTQRPLHSRLPTHLVLKANASLMRLPKNFARVNVVVHECCRKHGIKLYEYANVGNHLHLLIRIRTRAGWAAFIRELAGRLGRMLGGKLWKHRPFTRVVQGWRKAYQAVKSYVVLNRLEAEGVMNRRDLRALEDLRARLAMDSVGN